MAFGLGTVPSRKLPVFRSSVRIPLHVTDLCQEEDSFTRDTHTNHYLLNFLLYKVYCAHEVRINS